MWTGTEKSRPRIAARLGERVLGARAALGRRQPAAPRGDRAALDAVRRRHLHRDRTALAGAVLGELVDLRRAHPHPELADLPRHLGPDANVVLLVVPRSVAGT